MNGSPEEPDEFVFDEAFIAAAKFKEPAAKQRQGSRLQRWKAKRRRRRMARRPGTGRFTGPRTLALAIVIVVVVLALVLEYVNPLGV